MYLGSFPALEMQWYDLLLQDITAMEEEKDQLIKRVERLRKRVKRRLWTSKFIWLRFYHNISVFILKKFYLLVYLIYYQIDHYLQNKELV